MYCETQYITMKNLQLYLLLTVLGFACSKLDKKSSNQTYTEINFHADEYLIGYYHFTDDDIYPDKCLNLHIPPDKTIRVLIDDVKRHKAGKYSNAFLIVRPEENRKKKHDCDCEGEGEIWINLAHLDNKIQKYNINNEPRKYIVKDYLNHLLKQYEIKKEDKYEFSVQLYNYSHTKKPTCFTDNEGVPCYWTNEPIKQITAHNNNNNNNIVINNEPKPAINNTEPKNNEQKPDNNNEQVPYCCCFSRFCYLS